MRDQLVTTLAPVYEDAFTFHRGTIFIYDYVSVINLRRYINHLSTYIHLDLSSKSTVTKVAAYVFLFRIVSRFIAAGFLTILFNWPIVTLKTHRR